MDNLTLTGGNVVVGRFDFAACNHLHINHQLSPTRTFSWGSLILIPILPVNPHCAAPDHVWLFEISLFCCVCFFYLSSMNGQFLIDLTLLVANTIGADQDA